jgi:hypothetical protein
MRDNNPNKAGYSIPKSYKPLVKMAVSIVVISDLLFLFVLFSIIGLREALGLDATLIGLSIAIFCFKSVVTAFGIYTLLRDGLGVTYFIVNNKLHIQSSVRSINSQIIELKEVQRATSSNSYQLFKKTDYGDVIIEFSKHAQEDKVILRGVLNPDLITESILRSK